MTIKQFIEKAIEGGFTPEQYGFWKEEWTFETEMGFNIEKVVLNPKAWQAVGWVWTAPLYKENITVLDFNNAVNVCEGYNEKMILMASMPLLVSDENGDIDRSYEGLDGKIIIRHFRYDPKEAIKQVCGSKINNI